MQPILSRVAVAALRTTGEDFVRKTWRSVLAEDGPHSALMSVLSEWTASVSQPLILFVDEIDALIGDTQISVLRQLRAGYRDRPRWFPQSVVLCGVRDVRDYRIIVSAEKGFHITGGSAFSIKAKSLRLGDFREEEVRSLLMQHTDATGQRFEADALDRVWDLTQGQPWLVNALAYETCFEDQRGRDRSRAVTVAAIDRAKEALILNRVTHLHQLADKLREERVRRVILPMLAGSPDWDWTERDVEHVRDLGLGRRRTDLQIVWSLPAVPARLHRAGHCLQHKRWCGPRADRRAWWRRACGRLPDTWTSRRRFRGTLWCSTSARGAVGRSAYSIGTRRSTGPPSASGACSSGMTRSHRRIRAGSESSGRRSACCRPQRTAHLSRYPAHGDHPSQATVRLEAVPNGRPQPSPGATRSLQARAPIQVAESAPHSPEIWHAR